MGKKTALIAASSIVVLDQTTKLIIKNNLVLSQSKPLIKNILHFTYVTNSGSAFGWFKDFNFLLIIFSFCVISAIFYFYVWVKIKNNQMPQQIAAGLLLGGTIGNLIDRVFYGYVIDFIDFRIWPVFNIADIAVTTSVIILLFYIWKKKD